MASELERRAASLLAACALATLACAGGGAPESAARPDVAPRDSSASGAAGIAGSAHGRSATDEDWSGTSAARVEELFEGRFPGVRVTQVPGQGISVRIRGATSVNGNNEPLYVIDGFPIATNDGLVALNPSDIARIEVLKDAGSTAEYGVRGANGVVVITTKRNR